MDHGGTSEADFDNEMLVTFARSQPSDRSVASHSSASAVIVP